VRCVGSGVGKDHGEIIRVIQRVVEQHIHLVEGQPVVVKVAGLVEVGGQPDD
jgi:hypothetical protein